jgi:hypothetical protein
MKSLSVQLTSRVNCIAMNGSASNAAAPPQPIIRHGTPVSLTSLAIALSPCINVPLTLPHLAVSGMSNG